MLSVRHIDARNSSAGDALVEPLAAARHSQPLLLGGGRQSFGEGKVSRQTCDLLCENCHHADIRFNSVCHMKKNYSPTR